jgi:hypothetical protein
MKNWGVIFVVITGMFVSDAIGQIKDPWCITDSEHQKLIEKDANILINQEKLEQFTAEFIKNKTDKTDTIIIPVVFHVVHNYGIENISKAQIQDEINVLNRNYRRLRDDYDEVHPSFQEINVDGFIEFRLAKLDPDGNPTDGVLRYQSLLTYNATNEVKIVIRGWPPESYLNIWTVASIEGNAAAWSHYPGVSPIYDGVVSLHSYVGTIGTGSAQRSRTISHEIGHYLNLAHPWGSSNEPGVESNCFIDDDVDDTPLTIGNTSCNIHAESCGSLDNVQNYMEYSYCPVDIFTSGQIDRMRAALYSPVSNRNNLWTQENHILTGIAEGMEIGASLPVADFKVENRYGCVGEDILLEDLSNDIKFKVYNSPFFYFMKVGVFKCIRYDSHLKRIFL